jgi:hypothetical protein
MRRLDDLADGQKHLQPKEFLEKATARRPPKVYAAAVAEAAATEPRPADRARQDGVGAVLDALDGFMAARGRRCRHLFHDLAAHATETAGLHAAEGLRVSDARDALEAWIASGALAFERDESKLLEAAGARDAGDERAFLKSDRARRGLGGAKFVEARPAPVEADAGLDFAGYAARLASDDGAPGLDPLALERALLAARTKGEAAAGDARGALALRGACARLAAFDEDPERWVAGLCDGGVLMKRHLAGGLARLAGGDGAEDAAAALGAARADAVFKFADAESDALAAGEALGALAAALGERGAAVLRIAHHGSTAGDILDFARARRWTAAEVARQIRSAHAKRAGPPPRGRTAEPAMTPTTTVRVVSVAALRLALDEWRLAAAGAAPPLADESASVPKPTTVWVVLTKLENSLARSNQSRFG